MRTSFIGLAGLVLASLAACGESTSAPLAEGTVAVRLEPPSAAAAEGPGDQDERTIQGINGTLVLEDVRMVLTDFELKRDDQITDCATARAGLCADLGLGPTVADVPLRTGVLTLGQTRVPAGEYEELEFDVVDLRGRNELLTSIRSEPAYADWPEEASIAIAGEFRDAQTGEVRPFRTYFAAAVAVEAEFAGALSVDEGGTSTVVLRIDPATWLRVQGAVVDLSAFDYPSTGQVPSFQFAIQSGLEIEIQN